MVNDHEGKAKAHPLTEVPVWLINLAHTCICFPVHHLHVLNLVCNSKGLVMGSFD